MSRVIRNICLFIISTVIKLLWIFPINSKQILFISFSGQFSDSPRYIYDYLNERKVNYNAVWVVSENGRELPMESVRVKGSGIRFFYYMATSKVIITNDFINTYYPRRKGQYIMNTWHGGSPLKTVGMVGTLVTEGDIDFFRRHNRIYSCFLSSSKFMSTEVFRKSFGYTGKILETGMPRNAILLKEHSYLKKKVREYFEIADDTAIVLYAPTFRGAASDGGFLPEEQQFCVPSFMDALMEKFGNRYCFLFRAHHACKGLAGYDGYYSASEYPDMQELLCAADVLVTDYSSCMGDMALMNKPVFLYCPDLDDYILERGFYWDIFSLPFPVAKDEKELLDNIRKFDYDIYKKGIGDYLMKLGSFENANADQIVGDIIIGLLTEK